MVKLVLPGIPPSSNHAYGQRGKKRFLTKEGQKYKNETTAHLVTKFRKELMIFTLDCRVQLHFRFWTNIYNQNWKPGGKVKSRYKKFDGANLTKLLEDCLCDVGGYDDSQTMTSTWQKLQVEEGEEERTEIFAWNLDVEHDPFDYAFTLRALSAV